LAAWCLGGGDSWVRVAAPLLRGGGRWGRDEVVARRAAASSAASADEADVRAEVEQLRAREIKQQLEAAGVSTADIFEKDDLADRLVQFRLGGDVGGAPAAAKDEPAESAGEVAAASAGGEGGEGGEVVVDAETLERCRAMRVKELRTELGTRDIPWADAFEKEELVQRLARVFANEAASRASFCRSGRILPGAVAHLSGEELEEELQDGSTPLLLDVYATWCGPCQMMAPYFESAAKKLGSRVRVAKIDSDKAPDQASKLRVGGLPTIILFGRDGKEVMRQEGALMEQQLIDMVNRAGL